MPDISVIVPCYNQEKYIAECLDSILAQTFDDYEIIVVNDGSTDNSLDIINQYAAKHKNIKVINQPNQGVISARNNAISQAKGKYIFPLDGDDKIAPECLEELYKAITSTTNRVVFCECQTFGIYSTYFRQPKLTKYEMYGIHENCIISGLFYKSDFDFFKGYKSDFNGYSGDDMDYWLNYIDNNLPMLRIKEILFYYRMKSKEESDWRNYSENELKKRIRYKNKLLNKRHPKMRFWSMIYKIMHCGLIRFFYQKKTTKSGKLLIKICKIPVFCMSVKIKNTCRC